MAIIQIAPVPPSHPHVDRFNSEDLIGFRNGNSNLYRYVEDAPLNGTDPLGLSSSGAGSKGELIAEWVQFGATVLSGAATAAQIVLPESRALTLGGSFMTYISVDPNPDTNPLQGAEASISGLLGLGSLEFPPLAFPAAALSMISSIDKNIQYVVIPLAVEAALPGASLAEPIDKLMRRTAWNHGGRRAWACQ